MFSDEMSANEMFTSEKSTSEISATEIPDELLLLALGDKILKMCTIMLNFRN